MKKILLLAWFVFFTIIANAQNQASQNDAEETVKNIIVTIRYALQNNQPFDSSDIDTLEKYLHSEPDSMRLSIKYLAVLTLNAYYIEKNIPKVNYSELIEALLVTQKMEVLFNPLYITCAYNMAVEYENRGLITPAIDMYELTLKAVAKVHQGNNNLFSYNIQKNIGKLYYQQSNMPEWLEAQEKATTIIEQIEGNDNETYLKDLGFLSLAYSLNSQYEKSDSCLLILQKYYEKNKLQHSDEYIMVLSKRAEAKQEFPVPQYEESIKLYEKILSLQKEETPEYANTLYKIAWCYRLLENFKQTKYYADKSASIAQKNPEENFELLLHLIQLYKNSNGIEQARKLISTLSLDLKDNITWLSKMSYIYALVDNYTQSHQYAEQAKIQADKEIASGNSTMEFGSELSALVVALSALEEIEDVIKYQTISLNITQKVLGENHSIVKQNYKLIAGLYSIIGNYDKALDMLNDLAQDTTAANYWEIQKERAGIYSLMGNFDEAIPIYETILSEQLNPLTKHDILLSLAGFYVSKAELLIDDNEKNKATDFITNAQEYAQQSLQLSEEEFGINSGQYISSLSTIASIYCLQDSIQTAKKYADICLDIINNSHFDASERATYLGSLAFNYALLKDFSKAIELGEEMQRLEDKADNKLFIVESSNSVLLSEAYLGNKDYDKAQYYYANLYKKMSDEIIQNFAYMTQKQRENYLQMYQSNLCDAGKFIDTNNEKETFSEVAYNVTLFSKGLLLRTTNDVRNAIYSSGNQNLIEQYKTLQNIRQQITALQTNTENSNLNYLQSLKNEADNLDRILMKSSVDYRNLKADLNATWKDVQKNLSENEVAIEFIDYRKENYSDTILYAALIIRNDSELPIFVPLFEESQLRSMVSTSPHSGAYALQVYLEKLYKGGRFFNGQKLYQLIWQPLEKYLHDIETVYYSPSGILHQISFSAIPIDTLCLIDTYNLHLVSSTREVVKIKQSSLLPIQSAVLYGGILYDVENAEDLIAAASQYKNHDLNLLATRTLSDTSTTTYWKYLQGSEPEVLAIEHICNSANVPSVKYLGVQANEESIKNLSGNSPDILHIATHGFYLAGEKEIRSKNFMRLINNPISDNPLQRSGLLFAGANRAWTHQNVIPDIEDGILTAEEIANLDFLNTKLVVLSACETGLGKAQNREGVFGLQRAFKLAGVETIVMSLWEVPDDATSKLMVSFYENLLLGYTKQEAFKKAQLALRQDEEYRKKYKTPFFWAAFVLMD
jgi:CHAT domain-containing protein